MRITINKKIIENIAHGIDNNLVYNILKNNLVIKDELSSTYDLLVYNVDKEIVKINCLDNNIKFVKCTCSNSHKNHRIYPSAIIKCEHELSTILYIDDYLKKCDDTTLNITYLDKEYDIRNYLDYDKYINMPIVFDCLTKFKENRYLKTTQNQIGKQFDVVFKEFVDYIKMSNVEKFLCSKNYYCRNGEKIVTNCENIEEFIMNNFENIDFDWYKNNMTGVFDEKNMSVVFKLFLKMKGVI